MILGIMLFLFIGILVNNWKFNSPLKYNNQNMDVIREYSFDSDVDDNKIKVRVNHTLVGKSIGNYKTWEYDNLNYKTQNHGGKTVYPEC